MDALLDKENDSEEESVAVLPGDLFNNVKQPVAI